MRLKPGGLSTVSGCSRGIAEPFIGSCADSEYSSIFRPQPDRVAKVDDSAGIITLVKIGDAPTDVWAFT